MLAQLFSSEVFWFWALILVQSTLIVFFVEHGSAVGAGFSLIGLLCGVACFPGQWSSIGLGGLTRDNAWIWFGSHAWTLLAGLAVYLFIGLGWGMLRWWMFVRHLREDYEHHKAAWLLPRHLDESAVALQTRAACSSITAERSRLRVWAEHCSTAALSGGGTLTHELKPAWKDYVQNGYRH